MRCLTFFLKSWNTEEKYLIIREVRELLFFYLFANSFYFCCVLFQISYFVYLFIPLLVLQISITQIVFW